MPPFLAAAEILASPVANTRIPQASALPTLEPVMAGPADTGSFMLMVTGAITGPWPTAQPAINAARKTTRVPEVSTWTFLPHLAASPASPTHAPRHQKQQS